MPNTVDDLAEWAQSVRDAEQVARDNAIGRDRAIKTALDSGMGATEIAKATGLARARIYQIRDGK